jgi:hypothetical protein
VKNPALARQPSGPLLPSPNRSEELPALAAEDAEEQEVQEAMSKAQPRLRLVQSKVHDDPVGLLPPSPHDVESVAETLSKSMRRKQDSSYSELKEADKAPESHSGGTPRGLGLIMRKVQVLAPLFCQREGLARTWVLP